MKKRPKFEYEESLKENNKYYRYLMKKFKDSKLA